MSGLPFPADGAAGRRPAAATLVPPWRRACAVAALALGALGVTAFSPAHAQESSLDEGFDDIATLAASGWSLQNLSVPVGSLGWFQGTPTTATPVPGPFNAYDGGVNAYIAANSYSTGNTGINDTGQTQCFDGTNMVACTATNTGDAAAYPRQDGRFGRDAQAAAGTLPKTGGGAAGFDFSCVLWDGTVVNAPDCTNTLTANTNDTAVTAAPTTDWACTRDNVTGLVWSLQIRGTHTWAAVTDPTYPNAGHNTNNRCGYADWRVPTRAELLSIVHFGVSTPSIDTGYFPGTRSFLFWTNGVYAPDTSYAWAVEFQRGSTRVLKRAVSAWVRLVRGGQ